MNDQTVAPRVRTLATAATQLSVSTTTLRRLIKAGELAAVRLSTNRIGITDEALAAYVASRSTVPNAQRPA